MKRYDINIYYEKIFTWKHEPLCKDNLNDIICKDNKIKIIFSLIGKIKSREYIYNSNKGYFTEADIINIIFSYYNGNLCPNELTNIKKIYEIEEILETRKDLLFMINKNHFNGFLKKDDIYYLYIE